MENASKALIIAGAILLSILIIALGIYVFNMAKNASSTSSLDELEVSQYNQQFTNYRGKQLGSGVISLLDKVIANAVANKESDDRLPDVHVIGGTTNTYSANVISAAGSDNTLNVDALGRIRNRIAERHYYYVRMDTDATSGLIRDIRIYYDENTYRNEIEQN